MLRAGNASGVVLNSEVLSAEHLVNLLGSLVSRVVPEMAVAYCGGTAANQHVPGRFDHVLVLNDDTLVAVSVKRAVNATLMEHLTNNRGDLSHLQLDQSYLDTAMSRAVTNLVHAATQAVQRPNVLLLHYWVPSSTVADQVRSAYHLAMSEHHSQAVTLLLTQTADPAVYLDGPGRRRRRRSSEE